MKKILVLLFLCFLPLVSYAQIKIEERVEINPQKITTNNPTSGMEPTFTYILSWPPDQYRRGKIQIISCYDDTTDTGWTSDGYATTSVPGRGHHIFKFINQRWYYDSHLGWGWYYDSNPNIVRTVLVNSQELNLGSTLGTTMGTIDIPLLEMESFICDSGFVKLDVVPTNWADCEEIGWFPTDPITLRIIQGDEFASFFNLRAETNLGNTVLIDPFVRIEDLHFFFGPSWDQDGLDDIVIVPKDSNYALPFTVVVEANINEVNFSNEIEFVPKSFVIETGLYPESITTGEHSFLDIYFSGLCSGLPFETKINVEIIKGQDYGSLIDPLTNKKTKTITNLEHWFGYAWVDYVADGISTEQSDSVIIRVSTTDPEIVPKEAILIIKPPPMYAYTVPDVLGADDTADVIIKHRLEDGTLEDFPPQQTFELAVLDGCVNGNFMVDDSINVYFANALQPIKFVTADIIDPEFDKVLIRVGTDLDGGGGGVGRPVKADNEEEEKIVIEERSSTDTLRTGFEMMIAEKKAEAEAKKNKTVRDPPIEAPIVTQCALDNPAHPFNFKLFVPTENEAIEILLGETKYFAVKKKEVNGVVEKIEIVEIETEYGVEPVFPVNAGEGWQWIDQSSVWPTEPVTKTEGEKVGVYWEKEKPVWNGSTKKGNLKNGIIRLVGRYWEEGKTSKVELKTSKIGEKEASISIEVKKPAKLGPNTVRGLTFINFKDVFGEPQVINDYCIKNSGKEGIPPQLIKAQGFRESKFSPSYRYEPWIDINYQKYHWDRYFNENNTFVVTETSMGTGISIPSNHSNVGDANYFFFPTKCAEVIARDLRTRYWVTNDYRCVNDDEGHDITEQFRKYFISPNISPKEEEKAIARAIDSVKQDLRDGKLIRYNFIAQSRIVASYNPFQQTYYNAVDWELHEFRFTEQNYTPEMLNEPNHLFATYVSRIKKVFTGNVSKKFPNSVDFESNNWLLGYEGTWYDYQKTYNGKKEYRNDIMQLYKIFVPTKEN